MTAPTYLGVTHSYGRYVNKNQATKSTEYKTVSGLNGQTAVISCVNGTVSVKPSGGSWSAYTAGPISVQDGYQLKVQAVTPNAFGAAKTITVTYRNDWGTPATKNLWKYVLHTTKVKMSGAIHSVSDIGVPTTLVHDITVPDEGHTEAGEQPYNYSTVRHTITSLNGEDIAALSNNSAQNPFLKVTYMSGVDANDQPVYTDTYPTGMTFDVNVYLDNKPGSVDMETMKLKYLIDQRAEMFEFLTELMKSYNATAKSLIQNIAS